MMTESVVGPMSATDTIQILLVDDLATNLAALEAMLESTGCRLVRAQTAQEALLLLLEQEFAAAVLDIKMPGISGIELARMIKQRRRTQHIPILLVTAYMLDETDMIRGYEAGAVSYLTKPINPVVLQSKIAVFVELFRHRRALADMNASLQREVAERQKAEEAIREVNRDLERRVAERTEALEEADRRKDEFLAMLAHELRNPLAPISYAIQILRSKCPDIPELTWAQSVVERQVSHMTRLVDDLLDVSRITRGGLSLQRSSVELSTILDDALQASRPAIEASGNLLTVSTPPEPIHLSADAVRLTQAVTNLLTNAAKYTESGGAISVEVACRGDQVEISVKDTGTGIPPAMLDEVFVMFAQVDRTLERSRGGLGVGLALVKTIVELHGGTVRARSEGVGRGSEFVITLPLLANRPEHPRLETHDPQLLLHPSHRILIAEDGRDAADSFAMVLTMLGHDVRTAYDGLEAVAEASRFRPGVIIMDIGMPKLNGYDAARAIRAEPWGKEVCMIALTGWGQTEDRRLSHEAGFNEHLTKPVDHERLRDLLGSIGSPPVPGLG